MSNHPSDQSSWGARTSRDDGYSRMHRDPYRDQDSPRRNWQQEGRSRRDAESSSFSPYNDRDFYEQNLAPQNYGQRGRQGGGESWPRNEDRENYSAAPDYGRSESYYEDNPQHPSNRYHSSGRQYGAGRDWDDNRSYASSQYQGGQSYGGANAPSQAASRWRGQQQAFRGNQGSFEGDYGESFSQPQYAYGGERNFRQPGYFQAGDFSQQDGYTRTEYPEDSYLHGGYLPHGYSRQNQQAGRTLGTQNWQERTGAQRGAFGLQSSQRGRGPQGYTRSDDRIREDICERLSEHHYIDATQIRVEVNQGIVTLEGAVDDRWQKYQTEDLVDATSGVKDIRNHLNVSRASDQSSQWTSQSATPQSTAQQSAQAGGAQTGKKTTTDKTEQSGRGSIGPN